MPGEKKTNAWDRKALRTQERKKARKKAAKEKAKKGIMTTGQWTALITATVLAVAILVIVNLFTVKDVIIENNKLYDNKVIKEAILNDDLSWSSLYVYLKNKFVESEDIPFIDTLEVSLEGPHTLVIHVYEKGIMGYLYIPAIGENAYFDTDGFVVETSTRIIEDVPQVSGLSCKEIVLYQQLPIDGATRKELLALTLALKKNNLIPNEIIYGEEIEPIVSYGDIKVAVGTSVSLSQKIERLAAIFPKLAGEKGLLHMETWTEEATSVIFDREG